MKRRLLIASFTALQALCLALMVMTWWSARENTLFANNRWTAGKDTGKYLFYTLDFLFQPLEQGVVNLTSAMGFQEILYRRASRPDRTLTGLAVDARIQSGGYLWILLDKEAQRLTGIRLSRNPDYPSGLFRYDEKGDCTVVERLPFEPPRPGDWIRVNVTRNDERLLVRVDGETWLTADRGHHPQAGGQFGFRGSGWGRKPVEIRDVEITFTNPATNRTWIEVDRFEHVRLPVRMQVWMAAAALAAILLRSWRSRVLGRYSDMTQGPGFQVLDAIGAGLILAASLVWMLIRGPTAGGLMIPASLAAGELLSVLLLVFSQRPTAPISHSSQTAWLFGIALAASLTAMLWMPFRHDTETAPKSRAFRHARALQAVDVIPGRDLARSNLELPWEHDVVPGRPLFAEGASFRDQRITFRVQCEENTVLDLVFQQQSYQTRGDVGGEALPLHRRLIRYTTDPDILSGFASGSGLHVHPMDHADVCRLVAGDTYTITVTANRDNIRLAMNGRSIDFESGGRLGFGETGLLVHQGRAKVSDVGIQSLDTGLASPEALGKLWPLGVGLVVILLYVLPRHEARRVERAEAAASALWPLAVWSLVVSVIPFREMAFLGATTPIWKGMMIAALGVSMFHPLVLLRGRISGAAFYGNIHFVTILAGLVWTVWHRLPDEHPFKMRFADEVVTPGEVNTDMIMTGPWINHDRLVGAHTYPWHHRFGGEDFDFNHEGPNVFVMGGSQAWGSGAADSRHTFAELIEDRLRNMGADVRVYNAAANGGGFQQMEAVYRDVLRRFRPSVLVVDAGLNECTGLARIRSPEDQAFVAGKVDELFRSLLEMCARDGVRVVYVPEPMCGETPLRPVPALYDRIRASAEEAGAEIVDVAPVLRAKETYHFVWWDTAHFAPYGHQIMAEQITPAVQNALGL